MSLRTVCLMVLNVLVSYLGNVGLKRLSDMGFIPFGVGFVLGLFLISASWLVWMFSLCHDA